MLEIDAEYHAASDQVQLRYLKKLHDVTKRNIIVYYSGWLKKINGYKTPFCPSIMLVR